jgi:hypothetical protein
LYLKKQNISNYMEKGKTMEARDLLSRNLSIELLQHLRAVQETVWQVHPPVKACNRTENKRHSAHRKILKLLRQCSLKWFLRIVGSYHLASLSLMSGLEEPTVAGLAFWGAGFLLKRETIFSDPEVGVALGREEPARFSWVPSILEGAASAAIAAVSEEARRSREWEADGWERRS